MKYSPYRILLALALLCGALAGSQAFAQQASLNVTLIYASNSGAGMDGSLRSYGPTLRKMFSRYDSFEIKGQQSRTVKVPGDTRVSLAGGNQVRFAMQPAGSKLEVRAHWRRGDVTVHNTTFSLQRGGKPSALVVSQGGGSLILLFTVR